MQTSQQHHWEVALRLVIYLEGHPSKEILLRADSVLCLTAYSDSEWASYPIIQRSVTGYFVSLDGSPISWKTKKEHTISQSSIEVEYQSMAVTLCELKWLSQPFRDLWVSVSYPIPLHCDNQATIHIVVNPGFHECTKHIKIDCHFVHDAF